MIDAFIKRWEQSGASERANCGVEKRPTDQYKDIVICQKINSDVMKHFLPVEQLIDNTELTPEETAETIMRQCLGTASNAADAALA